MSSSDVEKTFMALTKMTQSVHVFAEVKVAKVKVRIKILMFEARSESSELLAHIKVAVIWCLHIGLEAAH